MVWEPYMHKLALLVYVTLGLIFFSRSVFSLQHVYLKLKCARVLSAAFSKIITASKNHCMGGFICTFSLLISLSIILRSSKFRNQFTISSKYFDIMCYLKRETYSGPISFEVQRNDIWTDNIQSFEMPF